MGVVNLNDKVKQLEETLDELKPYIPLIKTLAAFTVRSGGVVSGIYLPQGDDTYQCTLDKQSDDIVWKFDKVVT